MMIYVTQDFKGTAKVTWLADSSETVHVYTHCVHYGELLTKPVLAPDDDFKVGSTLILNRFCSSIETMYNPDRSVYCMPDITCYRII